MIYDAALLLAAAQSGTYNYASTDYIDTVSLGTDAYSGAFFVVQISTAIVANSATPTVQFSLQTSDTSDWSGPNAYTLAASSLFSQRYVLKS